MRPSPEPSSGGMVLLALMLMLVLMGIALGHAATWWSVERQRDDETELLYAGEQYRLAIQAYFYATPSPTKSYPEHLEDLLDDRRFPVPLSHLRRLYRDPMTNQAFRPVLVGNQIIGVVSTSDRKPVKRRGFPAPYGYFADQDSYTKWVFSFNPPGSRTAVSNVTLTNP